jgi:glycosyltransferase involved in cell wall biosynthesis
LAPQLITVIVPVRNGEAHVADQLRALAGQAYPGNWELVVVDNGSRDATRRIVESWQPRFAALRIVDAGRQPGLNRARNAGARAADGDFLVFCDADDVVSPGWLAAMAEASERADIVGGRLEWELLNPPEVRAWRPQAPMTELLVDHGFLRYAPGGNLGVWSGVARQVGWDDSFRFGSSDHDFAWRAQLAGHTLAFAPDAVVQQRFRATIRAMAVQHFRYGRSGAQLQRAFRDAGLAPPDNRAALRHWKRIVKGTPDLCRGREKRGRWVRDASMRLGRLEGSLRARTLCL